MSEPTAPTPVRGRRFPLKMLLVASGMFLFGFVVGVSASPSSSTTVTSASASPAATVTVTSAPVPAVTVTAAPVGPSGSIPGDGVYVVGTDIKPGTYKTQGSDACFWGRMKDLSGMGIISGGGGAGQQVVTVQASDKAFQTHGCGTWRRIS